MTEPGGNVVGSTIAQPITSRNGLLTDSEMTSRKGLSFRRSGGTLYMIPWSANRQATTNVLLLARCANVNPSPTKLAHSISTMDFVNSRCTAERRDLVG